MPHPLSALSTHCSFKVTESSGRDLLHRRVAARQSNCVVIRSQVAYEGGNAVIRLQEGERLFEKGRLAGAGA